MEVEIVTASCCTRGDIEQRIERVLRRLQVEIPELVWRTADITAEPELGVKYQVPTTPALLIDGRLEFLGYPKEAALEAKIRELAKKEPAGVRTPDIFNK
jgi:hypothetical protein